MVSFLLGSGFSYDEGIPGIKAINKTFLNIKAHNIFLGTDKTAFLLTEGQTDPNGWFPDNYRDRVFFEEFIKFYVTEVVKGEEFFNYEEFIDYFYLPRKTKRLPKELTAFLKLFRKKYSNKKTLLDDDTNLLFRFYNIFAQLLAAQLWDSKYFENADYFGYPRYDSFINFLGSLLDNNNEIKVHTLNHDLFFDFLGSKQSRLWQFYCDGFVEESSPYFGELYTKISGIQKSYKVRLKYYSGRYNNKLCLYKLHGSIDTYAFNLGNEKTDRTRIKTDLGVKEFYKEILNEKKECLEYFRGFQYQYPDFLSGTTYKMLFYSDEYYTELHNLFCNNLENSDKLFVIGYGFNDKGINTMLEQHYLSKDKKVIVVDPNPNIPALNAKYNIQFVKRGVNALSFDEWMLF